MRAQAWRTLRAFTQAVAVLATLIAIHTPAIHPVPSQAQSTDPDPAPAFASDVDLSTRGAMQDSQLRATMRGLSLEQQFQGPMVVARDPQWMKGIVHRLSPPVRLPHERVARPRVVVTTAVRVLESFIEIRDKLNFLRGTLTARAAPGLRSFDSHHDLPSTSLGTSWPWARPSTGSGLVPSEAEPSRGTRPSTGSGLVPSEAEPSRGTRSGFRPTGDRGGTTGTGYARGAPWVWMLHPLTHESWYDVQRDLSADWVPWRPRGPPAFSLRTFRQDTIR